MRWSNIALSIIASAGYIWLGSAHLTINELKGEAELLRYEIEEVEERKRKSDAETAKCHARVSFLENEMADAMSKVQTYCRG